MSKFFFNNPWLITLIIGLTAVSGCVAFILLPRQEDPRLTPRAARILTVLPGANALRVESLVTDKLEENLREIEEIKELTSISRTNVSFVAIELNDDIQANQVDNVWAKIRDRMQIARDEMPSETELPEFKKFDVSANALIVGLRWVADSPPDYSVLRRTLKRLQSELDAVAGTEQTTLYGSPEEEILVTIDADKMSALNLTALEISQTIAASDAKVSAGVLRSENGNTLLGVEGELDSLSRIGEIPIRADDSSSVVSLEDIATVERTIRLPVDSTVLLNDQVAVALGVQVRASSRIDFWSERVRPILSQFQTTLPDSVAFEMVFEQSPYVEKRMSSLMQNLLISAIGVSLVILLVMGWKSALIVGASLPLVSLMVLAAMNWLGIPMHQMSLTGLVIALGLMIDNSIVVVDEVSHRMRAGLSATEAVSKGSSFLLLPLTGATVTTSLSFAPIILMGGPSGEFVGSIAIVTVISVVASLVLAMSISAPLAGLALQSNRSDGWVANGISSSTLTKVYRYLVNGIMKFPVLGVCLGMLFPLLGFIVALDLPEQFFPPSDRNQFQIEIELSANESITKTSELASRIRKELLNDDRIENVSWFLGQSAPVFYYNLIPLRDRASQYGQAIVTCRPDTEMRELLVEKQNALEKLFPSGSVLVRQLEQGPPFDAPIEIRLEGDDLDRLRELGEQLRLVLTKTRRVHHTRAGLSDVLPKITFAIDEQQARLAQIDRQDIANQLNTALEGITGGSIMEGIEELPVRVRLSGAHRADLNEIASMEVRARNGNRSDNSAGGQRIPLSAISDIGLSAEYATITHRNGRRLNEVQAFIEAGVLPSTVLAEFRGLLQGEEFELPSGYSISFGGAESERDDAVSALIGKGFIIATLMIATMVIALQSFRYALILFIVAGLSVGLGLGSLWVTGLSWGFMSIVAIMGMIGVAVNDSIVVLSSLLELPPEESRNTQAITRCVIGNTRHIIATTLTTMAGFTPLLLSQSEFWTPVAVAMSGGVGGATLIALLFVPSMYILLKPKSVH